jgi:hypothetical protein
VGLGPVPQLQVRLWNALCHPLLEYGSVLWGPSISGELSDELERVQTRFGKAMLGLPVAASDLFARAEAGMQSLTLALRLFSELLLDTSQRLVSQVICQARAAFALRRPNQRLHPLPLDRQLLQQHLLHPIPLLLLLCFQRPIFDRAPRSHPTLRVGTSMRAVCARYDLLGSCTVHARAVVRQWPKSRRSACALTSKHTPLSRSTVS